MPYQILPVALPLQQLTPDLLDEPEGSHRKSSQAPHFHRNGKEPETLIRQRLEIAEMFDDGNLIP